MLLKSSYNPAVTFLRSFGDGDDADAPRQRDIPEAVASWLAGTHGIDSIVLEKMKISKLQREFWTGRDQEQNRNRPRRKLEETTNTCIVRDDDASCVYVVGGPEDAREAVNRIKASQHIKLPTEPDEISLAAGNYIASIRHKFENDDLSIHLRSDGMRPGTRELRRLHRVDGEGDDTEAAKADDDLMRKIDLGEIVLEVPTWAQFLTGKCREMEKSTATGICFSSDAIDGRVIITIAGSTSTVKRGMEEIIRCIEGHAQYTEGDICLRRIRGESVDTDGFKKIEDSKPFDVGRCSEPFDWDRLSPERWCYVGAPGGGRPPK